MFHWTQSLSKNRLINRNCFRGLLDCSSDFSSSSPFFFWFLLLARYVPNVAERSVWEQCNIEDRPTDRPTDLAFCKISNGHISGTGHPIHFMFGLVGFSRSADRMDPLPVGPNPPSWKISNGHISGTGRRMDFMFGSRVKVQEKIMREE